MSKIFSKLSKRNLFVIISIITIILSFCIIIIGTGIIEDEQINIKVDIIVKDEDLRVETPILLTISNYTNDMNVSWDLGDGNFSYGKSIYYSYSVSDYYNITAIVRLNSHMITTNTTIGVKNLDEIVEGEIPMQICLRPFMSWEAGMINIIKPGISIPTVKVDIFIPSATGNVGVKIAISNPTSTDDYQDITLYEETEYLFKNSYTYSDIFLPEDHSLINAPYILRAHVIIKEGSCSAFSVSIEVIY